MQCPQSRLLNSMDDVKFKITGVSVLMHRHGEPGCDRYMVWFKAISGILLVLRFTSGSSEVKPGRAGLLVVALLFLSRMGDGKWRENAKEREEMGVWVILSHPHGRGLYKWHWWRGFGPNVRGEGRTTTYGASGVDILSHISCPSVGHERAGSSDRFNSCHLSSTSRCTRQSESRWCIHGSESGWQWVWSGSETVLDPLVGCDAPWKLARKPSSAEFAWKDSLILKSVREEEED